MHNPGYLPPSTLDHIDWLTCASLRDSENWFLDFDDTGFMSDIAGITLPSEMEQWFRKAGYELSPNLGDGRGQAAAA